MTVRPDTDDRPPGPLGTACSIARLAAMTGAVLASRCMLRTSTTLRVRVCERPCPWFPTHARPRCHTNAMGASILTAYAGGRARCPPKRAHTAVPLVSPHAPYGRLRAQSNFKKKGTSRAWFLVAASARKSFLAAQLFGEKARLAARGSAFMCNHG